MPGASDRLCMMSTIILVLKWTWDEASDNNDNDDNYNDDDDDNNDADDDSDDCHDDNDKNKYPKSKSLPP